MRARSSAVSPWLEKRLRGRSCHAATPPPSLATQPPSLREEFVAGVGGEGQEQEDVINGSNTQTYMLLHKHDSRDVIRCVYMCTCVRRTTCVHARGRRGTPQPFPLQRHRGADARRCIGPRLAQSVCSGGRRRGAHHERATRHHVHVLRPGAGGLLPTRGAGPHLRGMRVGVPQPRH